MNDARNEILRGLGFTSYPARAYLALRDHGPQTARSLALASHVPVGKIYSALRFLIERGAVGEQPGRPHRYVAAGLSPYLESQRQRLDHALDAIEGIKPASHGVPPDPILDALLDRVQQPIIVADMAGAIRSWNPASSRLFGYRGPEALHLSLAALVTPDQRRPLAMLLETLRPEGPAPRAEATLKTVALTRTGERLDARFELVGLPRNAQGRPVVAVLVHAADAPRSSPGELAGRGGGLAVIREGELVHFDQRFLRLLDRSPRGSARAPGGPHPRAPLEREPALGHLLRELQSRSPSASEQVTITLVDRKGDNVRVELAVRPAAPPGGSAILLVRETHAE